jgi:hypothetical protein
MKSIKIHFLSMLRYGGLCLLILGCFTSGLMAQSSSTPATTVLKDSTTPAAKPIPVKNTFEGTYIIDNQTCDVPFKKTFEFAIQHRFGTINNGYKDFYGIYAPAHIRLGFIYTPINNLSVGIGFAKEKMTWDGNVKYAIIRQSETGGWPASISYFGNMGVDTREKKDNFVNDIDRISYFNQLMIARKITEKLSLQVSGSISYFNNVEGYFNSDGTTSPKMKNSHAAIAFLGRYKCTDAIAIIANYDQPLTEHPMNNPHPNVSFGLEIGTRGHIFQIFLGNYESILQQYNNMFNSNDYTQSRYVIGFNITKKWHL